MSQRESVVAPPVGFSPDILRKLSELETAVGAAIHGKPEVGRLSLVCLLARGHLLFVDVPRASMTTLAPALARSGSCRFHRLQFTSDMLPSDVLGVTIYNSHAEAFEFKPGPIFSNFLLADEINRTTPKTQSALLEAMNEGQVTIDGKRHELPRPFMVIATQNPVEHHGTYPLPESQLDRFLMRLRVRQRDTRLGSAPARPGVARVPDARLEELGRLFEPPKVTHATVEYVDMPSISKENLRDPSYLASLRVVDAFAHVLRLFADETVPHEKGSVDPLRDLEDVETELALSDLVVVEKRLERVDKDRKKIKNSELDRECELLEKCKAALEENKPLRQLELDADDEKRLRGFQFLSQKPILYVLNLGENDAAKLHDRAREYPEGPLAALRHTSAAAVCGKIEAELAELPRAEQADYLASYGLQESGLARVITAPYRSE